MLAWPLEESILRDGHNFRVPNGETMLRGTISHLQKQNSLNVKYRKEHDRVAVLTPLVKLATKGIVNDKKDKEYFNHYVGTTGNTPSLLEKNLFKSNSHQPLRNHNRKKLPFLGVFKCFEFMRNKSWFQ
jgi:hypothetical protein